MQESEEGCACALSSSGGGGGGGRSTSTSTGSSGSSGSSPQEEAATRTSEVNVEDVIKPQRTLCRHHLQQAVEGSGWVVWLSRLQHGACTAIAVPSIAKGSAGSSRTLPCMPFIA